MGSLAAKIGRTVVAIGIGSGPAALVQEIAKAEPRIREIEGELARLTTLPALVALDLAEMEGAIAKQLSRLADLIKGNVPSARQALKKLLVDTVDFTPTMGEKGKQTYAFKAELSYGAIVQERIYMKGVPKGIFPIYIYARRRFQTRSAIHCGS